MRKIERKRPKTIHVDKIGRISRYNSCQDLLRKELMILSKYRCAYFVGVLKPPEYPPHIEHHRPKKKFPKLATIWHNLFPSCPKCNANKGSKYPLIKPLKPDTLEYSFDYWFRIDFKNAIIVPNRKLSEKEKLRAAKTIEWLGLNLENIKNARKRELRIFLDARNPNIDDYSYKFMLERS